MRSTYRTLGVVMALCAALLAGCAGSPTQQSTGEYVDDAVITTKVKTALVQADDVDAIEIDVDSFKGVVRLSGYVDSSTEADQAIRIASRVEGVDRVENNIEVRTVDSAED